MEKSDNCCEQGGRVPVSSTTGKYTFTLYKPYKDTNYHIYSTFYGTYNKDFSGNRSVEIIDNKTFQLETRSGTNLSQSWWAIGYVE